MKKKYALQYHLYYTHGCEGISVFMADSPYQKGDIPSKDKCSAPISWIAQIQRLEEFKGLVEDRPTVCAYISKMIRKKNLDQIAQLIEIHSAEEVETMLELLDVFIKITVIEDYVILNL